MPGRAAFDDQSVEKLSLRLLGGFAVFIDGQSIALPPACRRLIALLALQRRPVHRLWVCATLWPHATTHRAVASLRSTVWRLRPAGAAPFLVADPQYLQLAPCVSVDWHDAVDMIERLASGDLDASMAADLLPLLQAGELLDRWTERWVAAQRSRYHDMRVGALGLQASLR